MRFRHIFMGSLITGLALTAGTASADDDRRFNDPYAPVTHEDHDAHLRTPHGLELALGGGVNNFTNAAVNDRTNPGGAWTVRALYGSRALLAAELAYIGTAADLTGAGIDPDAKLLSNGAEGLLRLNLGTGPLQPYAFGGAAWKRYTLMNNGPGTTIVRDGDNVLEIPFGAGIAMRARGFVFDARFDYRPAFDEEMFTFADNDMDNWAATARIGFEL
jgi:hypothetical protein